MANDAPLVPGQNDNTDTSPEPGAMAGLADGWRNWMADPHNRAALMQFGVTLSQPISAGQNWMGQVGSAFGSAGEASDRITTEEDKQQELESKQDLRSSQAGLAEERAKHAGDISDSKARELALKQSAQDLTDQSRIQKAYNDHLKQVDAANKNIATQNLFAPKGKERPMLNSLSPEEFAARYRGMGATGNIPPVSGAVPAASAAAPVPVQSPEDVAKLPSGTRYLTPDGRTGTAP
jgi:hypothetical protein